MLDRIGNWVKSKFVSSMSDEEFEAQRAEILKETPVPTIWLFGKTGSGKSSVVRFLTGADVRVGTGFRPETRQSSRYDFPSAEHPVLQFFDTRGLGESEYDPAEDIAKFEESANLMLVTVRLTDNAMEPILRPLHRIRKAQPERPILLALTCLHETYPGRQHPGEDRFDAVANLVASRPNSPPDDPETLPEKLIVALRNQVNRFEKIADRIVPIDLTQPEDGFDEPNFGGERLKQAIIELLPKTYRHTFLALEESMHSLRDLHERRAMPYILSAASMSATAGAIPVPWIDLPVVAGIQSELIRRLSGIYKQPMDLQQFAKVAGAVSGPMLLRQSLREPLKIIPGVGSAANAALAFATTFALGKACCWYFGEVLAGHAPSKEELREKMADQMNVAKTVWRKRKDADADKIDD